MRETGELAAGTLDGEKLYEQRARLALPILVRQAKAGVTISYSNLAGELQMPNPRNLNYVLGAVGNSMLDLGKKWGEEIPPIQALVINQATKLPGEGLSWFAPDAAGFKQASHQQRKQIVNTMLSKVYIFNRWDEVLRHLGLKPLPAPSSALPPATEIVSRCGTGEGEAHRVLKEAVARHPEWFDLPEKFGPGQTEVCLYSGDRVDVMFAHGSRRIAVEVKASNAAFGDLIRGLYQCVKYGAVLDAEARAAQKDIDCRAVLALGGRLPPELVGLRAVLGIEVKDRLSEEI